MPDNKTSTVLPRRLATKALSQRPESRFEKGAVIPDDTRSYLNQSARTLRDLGKEVEAIRALDRADGTFSTALFSLVQVANSGYNITAYYPVTHQVSAEGTQVARSVAASLDTLFDYTVGYADKSTLDALVEQGLRETAVAGGVAGELVLNKQRLPDRINWVSLQTVRWKSRGDGTKFPVQDGPDGDIELDLATFWTAEMHKDITRVYARPMFEAAINTAFYYDEFIEDMRKVVRRSGHTRTVVKLDSEKVRAAAPSEAQNDEEKMASFMERMRADVENIVRSLEPDDAIVAYDSVDVDVLSAKSEKGDYTQLLGTLSGIMATALKTPPSVLGLRLSGSQSLSNTESLIYLKVAKAIQQPVETIISRALTLATRLYGTDVYVKFRFNPIDLRPEPELEAFRTMKDNRTLQLLSLGFITDEEAAEKLGTGPRAPGAPKLSGTMFFHSPTGAAAKEPTPNDDPMGRSLQPDTPSKAGGKSQ